MSKTDDPQKSSKNAFSSCFHFLGQKITEHSTVFSTICFVSIFFLGAIFWMELSSSAEKLQLIEKNYDLLIKNKEQEAIIEKQSIFLQQADGIIKGHRKQIEEQNEVLQKLFQRLKELQWDPDSIARSEA